MNRTIRIPVTIASAALLATVIVGCGDGGGDNGDASRAAGIADQQQWCDVVGEVDGMFDSLDTSDDAFAVKQAGYGDVSQLLSRLGASTGVVDAEARPAVQHLIDMGAVMTETMVTADSEEAAIEMLFESPDSPFRENDEIADSGSDWIYDTCGIRVD